MFWKKLSFLTVIMQLCSQILICCFSSWKNLFAIFRKISKMDNTLAVNPNDTKKYISLSENDWQNNRSLIVFDFETSGLRSGVAEILQISAVWKNQEFNMYVKPLLSIDPSATAVNKLKMVDGVLLYKDEPVDSVPIIEALVAFLKWIESIPSPRIFLGHNAKKFDCRFLMNALTECDLAPKFCNLVIGFIDTLPLARQVWPGMPNYRQNTLIYQVLRVNYEEHNAIEDVRSLQKLITSATINKSSYLQCSFTSNSCKEYYQFNQKLKNNLLSYDFMRSAKGITLFTAKKLANNDIGYKDLVRAFEKGGEENVMALLKRKVSGKVVGTENPRTIASIIDYLEKHSKDRYL